ncbi:MAG: Gfo/Idh/MocA family oxidoreductase [bacterium]|nr:Gfo/Idh/MocA family oxidoreductase [Candidatus Margulisiibacteriota bacterium]
MKKNRGLKVGVIGVGVMGKHHARISSTLSGVNLYGVADINLEAAQQVATLYGAKAFENYEELLPEVDVVIITTPTQTHYEVASACINAGKHLLAEKPLAKVSEDAEKLVSLAKEKGVIMTVGYIERFNPAFQELQKLIRKEKIIGIAIQRLSPFPARINDANVIQDMMIHDLDLLMNLLPMEEIESIKAEGKKIKTKVLDKVSAKIFFASGIIATVEADRCSEAKTRKIVVTTGKDIVEADLLNKQVYVRDLRHPQPSVHHTKQQDQLTAELTDFFKAIKKGLPTKVHPNDGYTILKLAEEVEQACS